MKILYWTIQWTWGLFQNLVGFFIFLFFTDRKAFFYHGALVSNWNKPFLCAGCGMFIFMSKVSSVKVHETDSLDESKKNLLLHEYGHTIQSLILGPLFLFVITIPSAVWALCPVLQKRRAIQNISYYDVWWERSASNLGVFFNEHFFR